MKLDKEDKVVEKRQTRLNLRLNDDEYELIKSRAEGFGLPMATFVRVFLLGLPEPAKRLHDLPIVDPKLLRQIISIGNNVNQLTRYAHIVSNDPKKILNTLELAFVLQTIADELQFLREQYSLKYVESEDDISHSPVVDELSDSPIMTNLGETIKC